MNKFSVSFMVFLCWFICLPAQAFVLPVSEKQLNGILQLSFPMERQFQGIKARFYQPSVRLSAANQKVYISTFIHATQGDQSIRASGTIEGVFAYDSSTQTIQFQNPTLHEFDVIDNQLTNSQATLDTIRQQIGQNLPVILLVDFKQLNLGIGAIVPRDMVITERGLEITL